MREASAYDCREHPPFYACSEGLRAIVSQVPQSPLVAGLVPDGLDGAPIEIRS